MNFKLKPLLLLLLTCSLFTHTKDLMNRKDFILKLHEIGALKFGTFTLKSGIESPIYIDLRRIVSFPDLLQTTADMLWEKLTSCDFDYICGVPYTALPFATILSVQHNIPMIMRRKEVKQYGTKQILEGVFPQHARCLVIEDLFSTGGSALETVEILEKEDCIVTDIAILIDREHGGVQNVQQKGYNVHVVFTISEILAILHDAHLINQESVHAVRTFISEQQISSPNN